MISKVIYFIQILIKKSKSENIYVANLQLNLPNNVKIFNILDENEIDKIIMNKKFKIE